MPVKEVQSSDDAVSKAEFAMFISGWHMKKKRGGGGRKEKERGKKQRGREWGKKEKKKKPYLVKCLIFLASHLKIKN